MKHRGKKFIRACVLVVNTTVMVVAHLRPRSDLNASLIASAVF